MATYFFRTVLVLFFSCAAAQADIIDASLVLRFNFDAAPVNDVIVDSSPGTPQPGTNLNTTWVASETGRSGVTRFTALIPDQVTVPAIPALNSSTGTISFWMKSSGASGPGDFAAIIFDRRTGQGGDVITLRDDGTLFVQARGAGGGANSFSTQGTVNNGTWHHITYVYDQSATGFISIYVDGVLDTTQVNSAAWAWPAAQPLEIGSSHDSFWRMYAGTLDDFMVHNRVLTDPEIVLTAVGTPVTDSSLVLRLNFAAAPVNNVVDDTSTSNNDGTNRGALWVASDTGRNGVMQFDLPLVNQIAAPYHADFDSPTGTIAFWMKTGGIAGPGEFAAILFDRRIGGSGDVITMTESGNLFVQAHSGGGPVNSFSTAGTVDDDLWHHVAYVYDQSATGSVRIYIDGALGGSQTNSAEWFWPIDQALELGKSHDGFWFAYDGFLDEFRIYNRPLSASEVAEIGVQPRATFLVQPQSDTVFVGDDGSLTSLANFDGTYQWYLDGGIIPNATNANLNLVNVQSSNAGSYHVVFASAIGTTNSNPAVLTVNPRPTLDQSLVARYNFDAAPVNNVVVDTAPGGEHPGTNTLAVWAADVAGRSGVMQFSSLDTGGQISIAPHAEFDSTKGAISFWMKSAGNSGPGDFASIIFDRRTDRGEVITLTDGGTIFVQARMNFFNVNVHETASTVNNDQWHHVVYVYDQRINGSTKVYLDGQLASSNPNSSAWAWDPLQPLELGKSSDAFWKYFDGSLDDVRFYNRTLSTTEVTGLFNAAPSGPQLLFSRNGQQLTLTWSDPTFVLQENTNATTSAWTNVPNATSAHVVTMPTTGNRFYRLKK